MGVNIVLSSPSGAGKTTITKKLSQKYPNIKISISMIFNGCFSFKTVKKTLAFFKSGETVTFEKVIKPRLDKST